MNWNIFDEITKDSIQELIDSEITESIYLDYKEALAIETNDDKREFLADVVSFANSGGGDIIFGLGDKRDENGKSTGKPTFVGIVDNNSDSTILKLENILKTGIDPHIPGIRMKFIEFENKNGVLVVRIPQSWIKPHCISFRARPSIYLRTNSGKRPLQKTDEIKNEFLSNDITKKITNFRDERIGNILSEQTPILMSSNPKVVFHIFPIKAFTQSPDNYDLEAMKNRNANKYFSPLGGYLNNYRFNYDGFVGHQALDENKSTYSYCQFFRNGCIEYVDSCSVLQNQNSKTGKILKTIYTDELQGELIKSLNQVLSIYKENNTEAPIVVFLSLLSVKGFKIYRDNFLARQNDSVIDKNNLLFPDVIINDLDAAAVDVLKPIFDLLWNSSGYSKCFNYQDDGSYKKINR